MRTVNLAGQRVGRLTIVEDAGLTSDGHVLWLCTCDCGKQKRIASNSLRRRNAVQSCGCMNKTVAQRRRRSDGPWNEGKSYAILDGEHCYRTRHGWAKAAIRHYGNKCESCGWSKARCDVHHRVPRAAGGLNTLRNAVVLCPNCHRVTHEGSK